MDKQLYDQQKQEKMAAKDRAASNRSMRRTAGWTISLLAVAGALVWLFSRASAPGANSGLKPRPVAGDDWIKGNPEGTVTLIEYSDFQCPACASYAPIIDEIISATPELRFVYRHFPLKSIHRNAAFAGRAAEAAGKQKRFFEMHDLLFKNQNEWKDIFDPDEKFAEYAAILDLDVEKFKTDWSAEEAEARVERDFDEAARLGLNATPTFFLNDKKIVNPRSAAEFLKLISAALPESNPAVTTVAE